MYQLLIYNIQLFQIIDNSDWLIYSSIVDKILVFIQVVHWKFYVILNFTSSFTCIDLHFVNIFFLEKIKFMLFKEEINKNSSTRTLHRAFTYYLK